MEINVNVIKTAHKRNNFLKTLVSQKIFTSICLGKNMFLKGESTYYIAPRVIKQPDHLPIDPM